MSPLTTVPTLETLPKTMYLVDSISTTDTSIKINYVPLAMTAGIMLLDEGLANEERFSFAGVTDNGDGTATLTDCRRGLSYYLNDFAEVTANKKEHTGGVSSVRLVFAHEYANHFAKIDQTNSFEDHQLMLTTKEWRFVNSGTAIWRSAGGDLTLKDANQSAITLSALAALSGTDEKVKASINDTTNKYLSSSLVAGDGITLTILNPAGNETYEVKQNRAKLLPTAATTLTIATGAITVTQTNHKVDTEGAASTDDLDTISGGSEGQIIVLRQANSARAVVVKNGTGNIVISSGDYTMSDGKMQLALQYDGTNWRPITEPGRTATYFSKIMYMGRSASSTSGTGETTFATHNITVPGSTLISGVGYRFSFSTFNDGTNSFTVNVKLGSTTIASVSIDPVNSGQSGRITGEIFGTAAAGASVAVDGSIHFMVGNGSSETKVGDSPTGAALSSANVATNGDLTLQFSGQVATSGTGSIFGVIIEKISTTAFT